MELLVEQVTPLALAVVTAIVGVISAWILARVRSGRLTRTVAQAGQAIEVVERCLSARDRLGNHSGPSKDELDELIALVARSIKEDYVSERELLPRFQTSTQSVRSALLLNFPNRAFLWFIYILFYTCLLFMAFVVIGRIAQNQFSAPDLVAIVTAGIAALMLRGLVGLLGKSA